jgi:hypothetical protein
VERARVEPREPRTERGCGVEPAVGALAVRGALLLGRRPRVGPFDRDRRKRDAGVPGRGAQALRLAPVVERPLEVTRPRVELREPRIARELDVPSMSIVPASKLRWKL